MMAEPKKVCIMMADYGHEPTEAAVPYTAFKEAGFDVSFATETGKSPLCDELLISGLTQKLLVCCPALSLSRPANYHLLTPPPLPLPSSIISSRKTRRFRRSGRITDVHLKQGAKKSVIAQYNTMLASAEHITPLSWSSPEFNLTSFDLVYLPGGHDKGVRQIIDSSTAHEHLAGYFPLTRKSSANPPRAVAAICHGPLVLANTISPETGHSVLYDCKTTALPAGFEKVAYWGTRLWLGDYYKTYGKGSEDVEDSVRKSLKDGSLFQSSLSPSP